MLHFALFASLHLPAAQPKAILATNHMQGWQLRFDPQGVSVTPVDKPWRWGLELARVGFEGHETSARPAAIRQDGERISLDRPNLEEWFVNQPSGLEHGFTLRERPAGTGRVIVFEMRVRGNLTGSQEPDGAVSFSGAFALGGLKAWDADGRPLPAHMEAGAGTLRYRVEARGARYPVTVDPVLRGYLKASNPDASDFFGSTVAISGNTAVVGAFFESSDGSSQANNSAQAAGAAYVYVRTSSGWVQQAFLKAPQPAPFMGFGWSVAISGNTIVVGAPGESTDGQVPPGPLGGSGAAYVYVRASGGNTWTLQARLKALNPDAQDIFGRSVAISGDTIVVGAPGEDGNGADPANNGVSNSGAAYVFVRNGTDWTQQAYLKASNPGLDDAFGEPVAIHDNTIIVGAPQEDSNGSSPANNSAPDAGAAYVYFRPAGTTNWTQQTYLKAPNAGAGDLFGKAVTVWGDTVMVGAPEEDSSHWTVPEKDDRINAGAVYVFTRPSGGSAWTYYDILKAEFPFVGDRFGSAVSMAADAALVGIPGFDTPLRGGDIKDESFDNRGAARMYVRLPGGFWEQYGLFRAFNEDPGDQFGSSLAMGTAGFVVGAVGESSNGQSPWDNSRSFAGAAYVWNFAPLRMEIISGTPQNTVIDESFRPLVVRVTDENGAPVPGLLVNFWGPNAGPSIEGYNSYWRAFLPRVRYVTDANGIASAEFLYANIVGGGPYPVVAFVWFGPQVTFQLSNLVRITVNTNLPGPTISADGSSFTNSRTLELLTGTNLTLGSTTPQSFNGGQSRYAFRAWSNNGAMNQTLRVPDFHATYTANFAIEHQLTTSVNPAGTGTIAPGPGFYPQGNAVPVSATPNPGFFFAGFTGALTGMQSPQNVVMDGPRNVVANFTLPASFLVRYMSHLNLGDSIINLTNTGERGVAMSFGTSASVPGSLCANVYAFSPDEQMVACCSCPVTPNGLVSLSGREDILTNTMTPVVPTSLVIKLVASVPSQQSGCADSASSLTAADLAPGLVAWGTTVKVGPTQNHIVETPFVTARLSLGSGGPAGDIGELGRLRQLCNFIRSNGSGFGVCRSCRLGALGARR